MEKNNWNSNEFPFQTLAIAETWCFLLRHFLMSLSTEVAHRLGHTYVDIGSQFSYSFVHASNKILKSFFIF